MRAGVIDTPPVPWVCPTHAWRAAELMASPEMMMTIVRIGACPRPIVLNRLEGSRHYGRNHSFLHHHRPHTHRPPYDVRRRHTRRHHHEEREQPYYSSYTALHKSHLLKLNTAQEFVGYEGLTIVYLGGLTSPERETLTLIWIGPFAYLTR